MTYDLKGGWIYVMMTSSDYNRFKVGRTTGNPLGRFRALRTSDPTLGFVVAFFVPRTFARLSQVEAALHAEFENRIPFPDDEGVSEWFLGEPAWAHQWIESILEDWQEHPVRSMSFIGQGKICRAYEDDLRFFYRPTRLYPEDGLPM